jgi:acetylglutamate kinase
VDEAIRKAGVLIEALGWIRRFRGKYVVIKLGGSALEEEQAVRNFLTDVLFLETVGMKPILVHGGGKAISQAMNDAGIQPRFVHGRRYTDDATLEIVSRVLATEICASLVDEIRRQGGKAAGLSFATENVLIAERLTSLDLQPEVGGRRSEVGGQRSEEEESAIRNPQSAIETIDLGHVGQVVDINRELLDQVLAGETIPVLPSVGMTRDGQKLNINADTAAAAVARLLKAEKLVFLSDVPGIFRDRSDPATLISHLEANDCRNLIADGTIDAGMIPKVEAALEGLEAGVGKVHLVDARMPHSVLLEIYSNVGVGTEIVR